MTWARLAFRLQPSSIGFATFVCLGPFSGVGVANGRGSLYAQIVQRESAVLSGTAVLLALATTFVVSRRRSG
jgi:hypothetical protein